MTEKWARKYSQELIYTISQAKNTGLDSKSLWKSIAPLLGTPRQPLDPEEIVKVLAYCSQEKLFLPEIYDFLSSSIISSPHSFHTTHLSSILHHMKKTQHTLPEASKKAIDNRMLAILQFNPSSVDVVSTCKLLSSCHALSIPLSSPTLQILANHISTLTEHLNSNDLSLLLHNLSLFSFSSSNSLLQHISFALQSKIPQLSLQQLCMLLNSLSHLTKEDTSHLIHLLLYAALSKKSEMSLHSISLLLHACGQLRISQKNYLHSQLRSTLLSVLQHSSPSLEGPDLEKSLSLLLNGLRNTGFYDPIAFLLIAHSIAPFSKRKFKESAAIGSFCPIVHAVVMSTANPPLQYQDGQLLVLSITSLLDAYDWMRHNSPHSFSSSPSFPFSPSSPSSPSSPLASDFGERDMEVVFMAMRAAVKWLVSQVHTLKGELSLYDLNSILRVATQKSTTVPYSVVNIAFSKAQGLIEKHDRYFEEAFLSYESKGYEALKGPKGFSPKSLSIQREEESHVMGETGETGERGKETLRKRERERKRALTASTLLPTQEIGNLLEIASNFSLGNEKIIKELVIFSMREFERHQAWMCRIAEREQEVLMDREGKREKDFLSWKLSFLSLHQCTPRVENMNVILRAVRRYALHDLEGGPYRELSLLARERYGGVLSDYGTLRHIPLRTLPSTLSSLLRSSLPFHRNKTLIKLLLHGESLCERESEERREEVEERGEEGGRNMQEEGFEWICESVERFYEGVEKGKVGEKEMMEFVSALSSVTVLSQAKQHLGPAAENLYRKLFDCVLRLEKGKKVFSLSEVCTLLEGLRAVNVYCHLRRGEGKGRGQMVEKEEAREEWETLERDTMVIAARMARGLKDNIKIHSKDINSHSLTIVLDHLYELKVDVTEVASFFNVLFNYVDIKFSLQDVCHILHLFEELRVSDIRSVLPKLLGRVRPREREMISSIFTPLASNHRTQEMKAVVTPLLWLSLSLPSSLGNSAFTELTNALPIPPHLQSITHLSHALQQLLLIEYSHSPTYLNNCPPYILREVLTYQSENPTILRTIEEVSFVRDCLSLYLKQLGREKDSLTSYPFFASSSAPYWCQFLRKMTLNELIHLNHYLSPDGTRENDLCNRTVEQGIVPFLKGEISKVPLYPSSDYTLQLR